jgi:sialic acid synthase SpsE
MCEEEFGLPFLCTAFDYKAIDMLDSLDVAAIKIGSAEAVDPAVVLYASERKPLIISTGGLDIRQVWNLKTASNMPRPMFMHCISQYPARAEDLSLCAMHSPDVVFYGYSSHYPGVNDAIFAFALHCFMVEKHYSDKYWGAVEESEGTDFKVSIGPHHAATICQAALDWHKMRGSAKSHNTLAAERALLQPFRERFYANNHQADRNQGQDQVAGSTPGRQDSELA